MVGAPPDMVPAIAHRSTIAVLAGFELERGCRYGAIWQGHGCAGSLRCHVLFRKPCLYATRERANTRRGLLYMVCLLFCLLMKCTHALSPHSSFFRPWWALVGPVHARMAVTLCSWPRVRTQSGPMSTFPFKKWTLCVADCSCAWGSDALPRGSRGQ